MKVSQGGLSRPAAEQGEDLMWQVETCFLALALALGAFGQQPMTNSSVVDLVTSGLSEDTIVEMVRAQPGEYTLDPQTVIALKKAGISEGIIRAMLRKSEESSANRAGGAASQTTSGKDRPVPEVGLYWMKNGTWQRIYPEVWNVKMGLPMPLLPVTKMLASEGFTMGAHGQNAVYSPVKFLFYLREDEEITQYQLVRLREKKDSRTFKVAAGGFTSWTLGVANVIHFAFTKEFDRTYSVTLGGLTKGEYGFVAPTPPTISGGRIYTFRLVE